MKITCEKCSALYEVDASRIPAQGVTLKCPRCQNSFRVSGPGSAATTPPPPAPPAALPAPPSPGGGPRYYLRRQSGKVFGPFLERAIASMLEQEKLDGSEQVSADGQTWRSLAEVPALAPFVRTSTAQAAPTTTAAADAPELADLPAPKGAPDTLADLPAPKGAVRHSAPPAARPASPGSLEALADLPAPKAAPSARSAPPAPRGGLADLPAPRGTFQDLADLPAPKSAPPAVGAGPVGQSPAIDLGLDELADLPAPRGGPAIEPVLDGLGQSSFDGGLGEFDLDGLSEAADLPAPKQRPQPPVPARELADLPAPKPAAPPPAPPSGSAAPARPAPPPPRPRDHSSGMEYGQIDLAPDTEEDLGDLPTPRESQEPPRLDSGAGLPVPKAPAVQPQLAELPQPRLESPSPGRSPHKTGLEFGQLELGADEDVPELDELPLAAGPPDLVTPKPAGGASPVIDVVAPKETLTERTVSPEAAAQGSAEAAAAPALQARRDGPASKPRRAPRQRRARGLWVAAGALVFVMVAGLCLGLVTDFGFFGLNLINGDYDKRQRAKAQLKAATAALRHGTFQGYSQAADQLEQAARALSDQAGPWALQAQAAAALLHRFGPNPSRRGQAEAALARLQKLEDQSAETEKAKALLQLASGQAVPARDALRRLSDQEPGDAMAAVYFGWAQLASRDPGAAVTAFGRALAAEPQLPAALFGTAEAYCTLKDQANCRSWIEKTLAAAPDHLGAALLKAHQLLGEGKQAAEQAAALLGRVISQPGAPVELSQARTLLARHALLSGQANRARELLAEANRLDPRNAIAHRMMGKLQLESRQLSEAQRLLRTARDLDPSDLQTASMLARVEIAMNRPLEARKVVLEINRVAPQATEVLQLNGLVDEALGNLDSASNFFKTVIERDPTQLEAYHHLGQIHLRQGRSDAALAVLRQAEAKLPASAAILTAEAEVLFASKRLEEAQRKLEAALKLDANHNKAAYVLGCVLADLGQLEQARDRLLELKKRDQSYPGLTAKLGEISLALKQPAAAAAEYDLALAGEDPPPAVRLGAARAYLAAGRFEQALQQTGKLLDGEASFRSAAKAVRGEVRLQQGRLDEALIEVQQALDQEKQAAYFILLGRIHEARQRRLDALEAYNEALKLDPNLLEIRLQRAVLLVKVGTVKDGLKELKAVIARSPQSAEAYYYMGEAQRDLGQEAEAMRSWQNAVSRNPKHGQAQLRIGQALIDSQRPAQALVHLELATKAGQPGDRWLPDAYFQLGVVAQQKNQKRTAIEALRKYLELAPATAALRAEATKKLAALGAPVPRGR